MTVSPARLTTKKKLLFGVVALLLLGLVAEVAARVVAYQVKGRNVLAVQEAFSWLRSRLREVRREREVERARPFMRVYEAARRRLDTEIGRELRAELEAEYERHFGQLVQEVRSSGSALLVLNLLSGAQSRHSRFVTELVARHEVDYLDLSATLDSVPDELRFLRPADSHLTRYANQLVVRQLESRLHDYEGHSSGASYSGVPRLLGDFPASTGDPAGEVRRQVTSWKPNLGFSIVINAQGFRMEKDLDIPKRRQRVLCLGDSYTFGPHLNNQDTFPAILGRLRPDLEIINAGIVGYTITDQASLFRESAKLAAPDVTVLQVCDNDVIELTAIVRNRFARRGRGSFEPTDAEARFLAEVRGAIDQGGR
jgi:hypothetical protein